VEPYRDNTAGTDVRDDGVDRPSDTRLLRHQGAIWIDTANGEAGTKIGVNGLPENPVTTLADALTLATDTGLRRLVLVTGSLTLTSALTEFLVELRDESELSFGGQDVNGSEFRGGVLKGTMTGRISAYHAVLEDVVGFRGSAQLCGLQGTISLGAGSSTLHLCRSQVPGTQLPTLSFADATAECNLRAYSGGVQIEDMTLPAHLMSAEFIAGQCIVDSSCTGGTLVIRGPCEPITDSSAGTTVITDAVIALQDTANLAVALSASS
jgi:hypothetical protein